MSWRGVLFDRLDRAGVDLDVPVMPLAHMETAKQLADITVWSSLLIGRLGLDPELQVKLALARLREEGITLRAPEPDEHLEQDFDDRQRGYGEQSSPRHPARRAAAPVADDRAR